MGSFRLDKEEDEYADDDEEKEQEDHSLCGFLLVAGRLMLGDLC